MQKPAKKKSAPHRGMLHKPSVRPGLERDNKGKPIPMAKRLSEDRSAAKRSAKAKKKK